MKIFPYHTFTIFTPDTLPVVLQRMNEKVEAPQVFRFSRVHAPYQGTISEDSFQISRIIHYRNSFLPVIRGRFETHQNGTAVQVQMSLHPIVIAFLGFWFFFWYSATVPMALAGAMPSEMAVIFLGMPIVMIFVFLCAFWVEANRSCRELTAIVQGQTPNAGNSV